MSLWIWITVGLGSSLAFSLLVGQALATVHGRISRMASVLYETEEWALAPPSRALRDPEAGTPKHRVSRLK
jgi:hypothetical protein